MLAFDDDGNEVSLAPAKETRPEPITQTVHEGLEPEKRALLDTIAGGESPGYDAMYTGKGPVRRFSDFSDHPRSPDRITKGPNAGQNSAAAGRYQVIPATWDRQAEKLGLPNFRPENQDIAAADLAETTYGKHLLNTLKTDDDRRIAEVGRGLNGQWTSLPGGAESTMSDRDFVDSYRQNLAKYKGESRPASGKKYGFSDDELGPVTEPSKLEQAAEARPVEPQKNNVADRPSNSLTDAGKSLADISFHLDPVKKLTPPAAHEVPKIDPDYKSLEDSLHTTLAPQFVDKVRNVYEAATPDERQRLLAQPGEVGAVAQYIDKKYQNASGVMSSSPDLEAMGGRREDITLRNRLNGMDDPSAKQMADREVTYNTAPITGQAQSTDFDFERAKDLRNAGPIKRGAIQGVSDLKNQAAGLHFMAADLADSMGVPGAKGYGRAQLEARKKLQMGENEMGQAPNEFNRHLESAIRSTISNAPSLAAGVFSGGEAIPLLGLGAQVTGDEYANGVERGLSKEDALQRSVLFGSAEILGEKFGFKDQVDLLKRASGGNWKNFEGLFVKNLGEQLAGEMGTTYAQFKTDKSKQFGLNQDATAKDLLNQMKDTVYQTVLQTSMMGAPGAIRAANSRLKESDAKHDQPFSDAFTPVNDTYRQIIGTRIGALRNDPEFKEIMRHETNIDLSGMERAKAARQILAERRSLNEVNKPSISGEINGQDANVSNQGNEGREGIPSETQTGRQGGEGRIQGEQENAVLTSPTDAAIKTQQTTVPVNLNPVTKKGYTMLPSPEGIQIVDGGGNVISSHPKITDAIEAFDQLQANADNQQTQTATNKETSNELQTTSKAGSESTRFQNPEGRRQQASKGTEQGSRQEAVQEGNHGLKDREERASKLDLLAQEQDNLGNHSDAADWRQKAADVRTGKFVPEAYADANYPTGNAGEDVSGSSATIQSAASGEPGADVSVGSVGRGTPSERSSGNAGGSVGGTLASEDSSVGGRALTAKEEGELRGHNTVLKKLGKPEMTPEQFLTEQSAKLQPAASNRTVTDQEVVDAYNTDITRYNKLGDKANADIKTKNAALKPGGTPKSKKVHKPHVRIATTLPSSGSLQRRTAESIAKIFGHRVIFVEHEKGPGHRLSFDGAITGRHNNHILIAADSSQPLSRVTFHELTHGLRRNAPEIYGQLVRNLREHYNPIEVAKHLKDRGYDSDLPGSTDDPNHFSDENRNEEEWVADHLSDIIHDHKALKALAERMDGQKQGSGKTFLQHLKDFYESLISKLRGQGFGTESAVASKHLKKSRDAVVEALAKYHEQQHKSGEKAENSNKKAEPAYSIRQAEESSDVQRLHMVAQRNERETGKQLRLSDIEKTRIAESAESHGIKEKAIVDAVRQHKLAHPLAQGWSPLTYKRSVKNDKGKLTHEYEITPYGFSSDASGKQLTPGTSAYEARAKKVALGLVSEVRKVFVRANEGDQNAKNILAQAGWYKAMRSRLRSEFGGLGDLFADLLGATSPNTPVRENWKNAVDVLKRATRGDFDELMPKWTDRYARIDDLESRLRGIFNDKLNDGLTKKAIKQLPEYVALRKEISDAKEFPKDLLPSKESGALYGFNGRNATRALVDLWRVVRDADPDIGRGGTAPKALNFSGNLIGFREKATIDVWAARMLQRLAGLSRIPSMSESGVSGEMRESGDTTLQFGFGQDVFNRATRIIRNDSALRADANLAAINDDDLQAVVWFIEKELWTNKNWTSAAGEGGSFELEASLTGSKEQPEIRRLRKIIDSSKSTQEAKDKAKANLAKHERTADRFIGGLSVAQSQELQGKDFVPSDAEMNRLSKEIASAIHAGSDGATVLGAKVVSTEGTYGKPIRAFDIEAVTTEGFDPTHLWVDMLKKARDAKQESVFLSRILRPDEAIDYATHRPGIEVYFRDMVSRDKLNEVLDQLKAKGAKFFTVVTDGRRMPEAMAGAMPSAVGIRIQYIPEFEHRYGRADLSALTDEKAAKIVEEKELELIEIAHNILADVPNISFAGRFWYETQVAFSHEYEDLINGYPAGKFEEISGAPRGQRWAGQPVKAGIESADRQLREAASRESDGQQSIPVDGNDIPASIRRNSTVRDDAVYRARRDAGTSLQEPPRSYLREGRGDGKSVRLLGNAQVSVAAEWRPSESTLGAFNEASMKAPSFLELRKGSLKNADAFASAITDSKNTSPFGAAVYVYPVSDYRKMRLFLSEDGKSGVAVKADGDVVSVFGAGGTGDAIMQLAVSAGGKKLDAFDTILPDLYNRHGFVAVARTSWNDEFSPEGWNKETFVGFNGGEPDVVFMVYKPSHFGIYTTSDGIKFNGDDGYDKAVEVQEKAILSLTAIAEHDDVVDLPPDIPASNRRQTETPAFKKWFGDSKVVDENGKPLTVYHGTPNGTFNEFSVENISDSSLMLQQGPGFYFTDKKNANQYTKPVNKSAPAKAAKVYDVHLSLQKPLMVTSRSENIKPDAMRKIFLDGDKDWFFSNWIPFDTGVSKDASREEKVDAYVKSITRNGEFDQKFLSNIVRAFSDKAKMMESLRKHLQADGVHFTDSHGSIYVAWNPSQIKSATGNNGEFSPTNPDIRFSNRTPNPPFYSQLARGFESSKMDSMPASQWRVWLQGNKAKLGIKDDEIAWTGIDDFLNLKGKEKLTKADIAAFLKDNGVQVKEVMKGGVDEMSDEAVTRAYESIYGDSLDSDGDPMPIDEMRGMIRNEIEHTDSRDAARYEQYALPGGSNYRELLLTLPEGQKQLTWQWFDPDSGEFEQGFATQQEAIDARPSISAVVSRFESNHGPQTYYSGHWEEPNVLAHIRFNDRTDADGNKVLFVQEIQSDWAQQGRKKGFKTGREAKNFGEFARREGLSDQEQARLWNNQINLTGDDKALWDRWKDEGNRWASGKPAGPFVENTKSWVSLALKRIIRYAAEGGYDKVAFANGEQSADLYDLSKAISRVTYEDNNTRGISEADLSGEPSSGVLKAYDLSGKEVISKHLQDPSDMAEIIGKDMASKLLESEPKRTRSGGVGVRRKELSGLDLKVGGEGMKSFYDKIVPQVANEVLKKVGGGRMESVEIDTRSPEDDSWYEEPTDKDVLKQAGFVITPAMRDKALDGMPLFSNRKNVLGDTPLATWTSPKVTPIDNLIYTLQDKLVDTKRVQEAISSAQRLIADEWNPYQKELLYHGRTAKLTDDFLSQEVRPLFKAMEEKGVSMDELEEYLHNRHAEERNNQIASINPGMPDGGSGIETQDALDYLGMLSFDKATDLEDLADLVDEISRGTKKLLVSSGLEAQQTIDAWDSAYQYYVPLQREELEVSPKGQGTGSGHSIKGSSSKRATGSKRKVVDILANLMMQRERAIVRSEKNKVATALYGLAIQNENPGFWLPVNPDAIKNPSQVVQDLLNMGLDQADIDGIMAEPTETVIDSKTGLVTHRINPRLRNMDNVLATRINGKDRFLFFSKEDERSVRMVAALKNLDEDGLGTILTYFRKVTRWISAINTQYNPVFGVVNLARDVQGGMLNLSSTPLAGKQLAVLKNVGPAMQGIYSDLRSDRKNKGRSSKAWSTLWEEYQNAGGRTGYRDAYRNSADRAEALKKEIARIQEGTLKRFGRGIFDWLSDYNDTLENAIRLSAYKVAKDNGMTKDQAAALAKSITVNFNKKGQIASQAGSLYAFFNAGIQGNFRLGLTLSGNAGKKILAGGLILGAAQAALLAAAGFDDDEPPEFTKERNLIIPVGGSKYVTIPLPLGFHVIPNTSRILTELVIDQGKDAGDKLINLLGSFADAFDPMGFSGFSYQSLSPTAADPLVALAENRNSFGREIYKEDRSSLDPSPGFTRMKDTATGVSKVGAYVLNLISGGTDYKPGAFSPTPDQIDYLVGQATGGVGREVQKAAQFVSSTINGEDIPPHKIPLVGRFYGDAKSQSSETSRFYKNLKELNAHEREIKGRIKDEKDIKAYQEKHPEAEMVNAANNVEKMLTELKTRKRLMIAKGAPREEVKALEGEIASRIKQFNDDVKARSQK